VCQGRRRSVACGGTRPCLLAAAANKQCCRAQTNPKEQGAWWSGRLRVRAPHTGDGGHQAGGRCRATGGRDDGPGEGNAGWSSTTCKALPSDVCDWARRVGWAGWGRRPSRRPSRFRPLAVQEDMKETKVCSRSVDTGTVRGGRCAEPRDGADDRRANVMKMAGQVGQGAREGLGGDRPGPRVARWIQEERIGRARIVNSSRVVTSMEEEGCRLGETRGFREGVRHPGKDRVKRIPHDPGPTAIRSAARSAVALTVIRRAGRRGWLAARRLLEGREAGTGGLPMHESASKRSRRSARRWPAAPGPGKGPALLRLAARADRGGRMSRACRARTGPLHAASVTVVRGAVQGQQDGDR